MLNTQNAICSCFSRSPGRLLASWEYLHNYGLAIRLRMRAESHSTQHTRKQPKLHTTRGRERVARTRTATDKKTGLDQNIYIHWSRSVGKEKTIAWALSSVLLGPNLSFYFNSPHCCVFSLLAWLLRFTIRIRRNGRNNNKSHTCILLALLLSLHHHTCIQQINQHIFLLYSHLNTIHKTTYIRNTNTQYTVKRGGLHLIIFLLYPCLRSSTALEFVLFLYKKNAIWFAQIKYNRIDKKNAAVTTIRTHIYTHRMNSSEFIFIFLIRFTLDLDVVCVWSVMSWFNNDEEGIWGEFRAYKHTHTHNTPFVERKKNKRKARGIRRVALSQFLGAAKRRIIDWLSSLGE